MFNPFKTLTNKFNTMTLIEENEQVQKFIKKWQLKNKIVNFDSLEDFNNKFKKDMNEFLDEGGFSDECSKLFNFKDINYVSNSK